MSNAPPAGGLSADGHDAEPATQSNAIFPALGTLAALFAWRVGHTPDADAYRWFDTGQHGWTTLSWAGAGARVDRWRAALRGLATPGQARVAILLPNGIDAVCIDQACLAEALVPVPLHAIDNAGSIAYIVDDADAALLVVAQARQWLAVREALAARGAPPASLRTVLVTEPGEAARCADGAAPPGFDGIRVIGLDDWLAAGTGTVASAGPGPDDLAAIVYTSGTTGKPKGVMLSHRNVMANLRAALSTVSARGDDVFLSFLPLSHTFERTAGYYLPIAAGACVAYARAVTLIAEDLRVVRPTILISVPRIYERFFAKLQEALLAAPAWRRALFALAQRVGWTRFCRAQGFTHPAATAGAAARLLWPLLRALVARPVLALFGGRVRIAVSGGAPLTDAVAQCFIGLGLPLLQGYGMTETAPVIAVNTVADNWPQTVGRALPGVAVRIGEQRELQVRGDNVMRGYWKRPEDSTRALTEDGWLRTGDQAAIEGGRIRILGRIKEIIVTSTGEKIAPADLELAISGDPLFEQIFVFGDDRPFIGAIAVLGGAHWQALARANGLGDDPNAPAANKLILARLREATRNFPHYAQPRAVWSGFDAWTVENTLLTPTLKLKRNNLLQRYEAEIAALYAAPGRKH